MITALAKGVVRWRTIGAHEAVIAHALHLDAISGMASHLVRADTLEHFIEHTGKDGLIFAGFADQVGMVAYGVVGLSSSTVEHMTHLLKVPAKDCARFGILDGAASLPSWRGQGLHQALIDTRIAHANSLGYSLTGVTVAPGNISSLRGLLHAQFQVRAVATLYQGFPRLVLQRDALAVTPQWYLLRKVEAIDVMAHQAALKDGLTGYGFSADDRGTVMMHYGINVNDNSKRGRRTRA